MTVKELKEKIKENPRKVMNVELTKVVPIEWLELLDENLDVEKILEDKYLLTYQTKKCLEELYKQYDGNFIEEIEKFIDFASKLLPNVIFNYTMIEGRRSLVSIRLKYINNNKLMCKSVLYHTSDNKINHIWLLERITNTIEE